MLNNVTAKALAAIVAVALVFGQCGAGFAYAAQDGSALQGGSITLVPAGDPDPDPDPDPGEPATPLGVSVDYTPNPVALGATAILTSQVTGLDEGEQVDSYAWEMSSDGVTWPSETDPDFSSLGDGDKLSITLDNTTAGKPYRVVVKTDKGRTASSEPVIPDYIDPQFKVTRTLENWQAKLVVDPELADGETATYLWQKSTDKGETWVDVDGATARELAVDIDENSPNELYRAVVKTSAHRVATTSPIAPVDASDQFSAALSQVLDGTTVIISAEVEGAAEGATVTYRWQQSADKGETWTNLESESGKHLRVKRDETTKDLQFRVVVLTSDLKLAVSAPIAISQAEKQEQNVVFRLKAGDDPIDAVETTMGKPVTLVVEVEGDASAAALAKSDDESIATVVLGKVRAEAAASSDPSGPAMPVKTSYQLEIIPDPRAHKGETTVTVTVPETDAFKPTEAVLKFTIIPTGIDRLVADDKDMADNNTKVLQEEYDKLSEQGGGTIVLPEGQFYFGAADFYGKSETCIRVRNNVKLVGAGQDKTILLPVGMYSEGNQYEHGVDMFSWQGIYVENGEYLVNADFENFTIDSSNTKGSPTGYNAAGKGFYFQLFRDCDFRNVTVKNTDGTGFGIDYPVNSTIVNCRAERCGKNANAGDVGASGFGIGTGYAENESMEIRDCVALDNTKYGFFFEHQSLFDAADVYAPGGQLFLVKNCVASGNLFNFGGERSHDVVFQDCNSMVSDDANRERYTLFAYRLGDHSCRTSFVNCKVSQGLSTKGGNADMAQAATWAHSANVIDGPSGWVVDLDAMIPRSEAADLVWRTYGRPDPVQIGGNALRLFAYRDVQPGDANADVASWSMAYQTLVPGDFPGYFFPSRACSLAEFLYMAWRGAGAPAAMQVQIGKGYEWAEYALGWALSNGIVQFDDLLKAGDAVTRGQALQIAQRLSGSAFCEYKASLYKTYSFEANVPVEGFTDVPDDHWVVEEGWLNKVLSAGIMQGYTDAEGEQTGEFGPDDKVLRGQLATILYRYAQPVSTATTDIASYEQNATPFADCKDGQYYTAAINWAYRIGIMTGDASTKYTTVRPDDGVTREEAAAMLYRYAKLVGPVEDSDEITFAAAPDAARVSTWARTAMSWCYSNEVMTGDSVTGRLNPQSGATRAHIAKMAVMALGA